MWAAVLRSCALVAWVALGWAALVRGGHARRGRVGAGALAPGPAGSRLAQRRALRHWATFRRFRRLFCALWVVATTGTARRDQVPYPDD
eukprot:2417641-Prymnesium_polylepis.1